MSFRNRNLNSSVIVDMNRVDQNGNEELDEQVEGSGDVSHQGGTVNPAVMRRLKALRKLQYDFVGIEAKFYQELQHLEAKFAVHYAPVFDKRGKIIKGECEPTDEDCDIGTSELELSEETVAKLNLLDKTTMSQPGIPEFWLTVFSNVEMLFEATYEKDFTILKHLSDIRSERFLEPQYGFRLTFHFTPNEFFKNSTLTKTYLLKTEATPDLPFYQGPMVNEWIGTEIDWYPGKNVTEKEVIRKQKHKKLGTIRSTTRTVKSESFFNFFNPPKLPEADDNSEVSDSIRMELMNDFEMGQYIAERVIPRAYLFYTGEVCQTDCEDEDEEDEDDEEEDGEGDYEHGGEVISHEYEE